MNNRIILIAAGVAVAAIGGAFVWGLMNIPAVSQTPETQKTNPPPVTPFSSESDSVSIPVKEKGTFTWSYRNIELRPVTDIPQDVAQGLCGIVYGDTCIWNDGLIGEKPFYVYGTAQSQPLLSVSTPISDTVLTYGTLYTITIHDLGPSGRYRVYLTHRNLLGEVDAVHEANVTNVSGDATKNLTWDLNEVFINEEKKEQVAQLKPGHYELTVANVDSGVEGSVPGIIQTVDNSHGNSVPQGELLKPYASNTPLMHSYWDGRGVFFDGKGGVDTIQLVGKRSDVVFYRGIDMPDKGQYQTLVIFRRIDNVVMVITNVEIIKMDDQTLNTADVIRQLGG